MVVATIFVLVTLSAVPIANHAGPDLRYAAVMSAVLWILAEFLTAVLLLGEFYVSGRLTYAIAAFVYATSGVLSIAYISYFPSILSHVGAAALQVTPAFFVIRSLFFAGTLGAMQIFDPAMRRRVSSGNRTSNVLLGVICATAVVSTSVIVAVCTGSTHLPVFVTGASGSSFTTAFTHRAIPAIFLTALAALFTYVWNARRIGVLQLWLAVSLVAIACDAGIDFLSPARLTVGWYVGALDTIGSSFAVGVVLMIEVVSNYARLTNQSRMDPLTGLRNRRAFDDEFAWALDETARTDGVISLLSIDIDHFKAYNDRYGHPAGDETIRRVAGAIASATRSGESIAGRYGGEEFVMLLPHHDAPAAHLIAERLRAEIEALGIAHADSTSPYVTVSIGVAALRKPQLSRRLLVDRADEALYEAKRRGRNLVFSDEFRSGAPAIITQLRRA